MRIDQQTSGSSTPVLPSHWQPCHMQREQEIVSTLSSFHEEEPICCSVLRCCCCWDVLCSFFSSIWQWLSGSAPVDTPILRPTEITPVQTSQTTDRYFSMPSPVTSFPVLLRGFASVEALIEKAAHHHAELQTLKEESAEGDVINYTQNGQAYYDFARSSSQIGTLIKLEEQMSTKSGRLYDIANGMQRQLKQIEKIIQKKNLNISLDTLESLSEQAKGLSNEINELLKSCNERESDYISKVVGKVNILLTTNEAFNSNFKIVLSATKEIR